MARQPAPPTLREQALLALDQSRAALAGEWERAREEWSPRHFLQQTLEKHRGAIMAAAAVAGFGVIRWLLPGRENSRDTFSKPAKKRTLSRFLLNGLWGMGREPLKALAAQQLVPLIAKILSEFQSRSQPPSSE